jgi:PIN domain nuclease of toxin-antitoxin system
VSEPAIVDASGALAIIQNELGSDVVEAAMRAAPEVFISAVNLAEVAAKMSDRNIPFDVLVVLLTEFQISIVAFDSEIAMLSGALRASTRSRGLSLGDRACLATAVHHHWTVITADRAWAGLGLDLQIVLIR